MGSRTLALDVGDRWIGIALSDPTGLLATPLTVVERKSEAADFSTISEIIERHQVGRVIVGLPRSLSGRLGEQAEKVQEFTEKLAPQISVPLEFRDERLSTVSAQRLMHEAGTRKGKPRYYRGKQKTRDDAEAAAVILQGYLDETRGAPQ
jgi:putative Holliday junction resolvase